MIKEIKSKDQSGLDIRLDGSVRIIVIHGVYVCVEVSTRAQVKVVWEVVKVLYHPSVATQLDSIIL